MDDPARYRFDDCELDLTAFALRTVRSRASVDGACADRTGGAHRVAVAWCMSLMVNACARLSAADDVWVPSHP